MSTLKYSSGIRYIAFSPLVMGLMLVLGTTLMQCSSRFKGKGESPDPHRFSTYSELDNRLADFDYIFCLDGTGEASDDSTNNVIYVENIDEPENPDIYTCDAQPASLQIALDLKADSYPSNSVLIILGNNTHTSTSATGDFSFEQGHSNLTIYGTDQSASIISHVQTSATAHTMVLWAGNSGTTGVTNLTFENLTINGYGTGITASSSADNDSAGSVHILDAGSVTFEQVTFTNNYYTALLIEAADSVTLSNSTIAATTPGSGDYAFRTGIWNLGSDLSVTGSTSISEVDYAVVNVGSSSSFTDTGTTYSDTDAIAIYNYQNNVELNGTTFGAHTTMDMFSEDAGVVNLNSVTANTMMGCQFEDETAVASNSNYNLTDSEIETFYFGTVTVTDSPQSINTVYATELTNLEATPYVGSYTPHNNSCFPAL